MSESQVPQKHPSAESNGATAGTSGVGKKATKGALAVGAIGIVFGDIGTSPLYAFRETFAGAHPLAVPGAETTECVAIPGCASQPGCP